MGSRSKLMSKPNVQVIPTSMVKLPDGTREPYGKLYSEFTKNSNLLGFTGIFNLPEGSEVYTKNKIIVH